MRGARSPGIEVVREAASRGVAEGAFGYGIGDGESFERVWLGESVQVELSDSSWLIGRDAARRLRILPAEKVTGTEGDEVVGTPPVVEEGQEEARLVTYQLARGHARLGMAKWRDFYSEVIKPLVDAGAEVDIDVSFEARSLLGVPEDTIDLVVRENLRQSYDGDIDTDSGDDA